MRTQKRAGDVEVGDQVYFPNSRRPRTVGQVVVENQQVHLVSDDAATKWMMNADFEVGVEVEEEPTDDGE